MQAYKHTLKISICCSLILVAHVQAMSQASINALEKEAWNHAFQGNNAAALSIFVQATDAGSWQAARLLAYNYGKEALLDQKDEAKAQFFLQQAENYKNQNPQKYFSESDLTSKIKTCKALQFARINPWYQKVLHELSYSPDHLKKCPTPEESIVWLFDKMISTKTDKQEAPGIMCLLEQAMSEIKSKEATQAILGRIDNTYSRFRLSPDTQTHYSLSKQMIKMLDTSACALDLTQGLTKAYSKLFSSFYTDYVGNGYDVDQTVIVDTMQELFPRYAELNKAKAAKTLIYFLNHDMKFSCEADKNLLRLLRLLPDAQLETYVTDLSAPDRLNVIQLACKTKDIAQSFQGTVLDLDLIAAKVLHAPLDEQTVDIAAALIQYGNQAFYHKHEDAIIALLPTLMEKNEDKYKVLISLAARSELPRLQHAAFKALVDYTASMDKKEYYWQTFIIEAMFAKDTFTADQRTKLYPLMNTIYQATRCIRGLQMLWMHVKDNVEQRDFLRYSLEQYFNVALPQDASASFESMLQQTLVSVQEYESISEEQFLETVKIAHETKLATCIDPVFLTLAKDVIIFDKNRSFQERATFLDQRLCNIKYVAEMVDFSEKLNKDLIGDDLRIYARDICIILNTKSCSFEVCKAKKSLQETHKKYGLKESIPEITSRVSGDLENFAYRRYSLHERPTDRTLLDHDLKKPLVGHDGLIYALAAENITCSLWAIDGKTLDGVWQVPIHNYEQGHGKEPKLALHNETIYLADGMSIRSFNSKTGIELTTAYTLKGEPVTCLTVDASGLVYVVQSKHLYGKATVTTIDPNTQNCSVLENNIGGGGKRYFVAGETFGYYYVPDKTITLYSKDGSKHVLETCSNAKESGVFEADITAQNNLIFFTKYLTQDDYHLVAYDTNTHTQLWNLPLVEGISTKPCVCPNFQTIFIMNEKKNKITAFAYTAHYVQELWSFMVPKGNQSNWNKVDELAISPDGTTLFDVNVHGGEMHTINTTDGSLIATTECTEGRFRHIVGVSQDNIPYIHPS